MASYGKYKGIFVPPILLSQKFSSCDLPVSANILPMTVPDDLRVFDLPDRREEKYIGDQ
jgi:hypothetical protein